MFCSADCCLFPQAICPVNLPLPQKNWFKNNRKISITKEICITIDSPRKKIPERKSDSEAGCIVENFTLKQGNSSRLLAAGTRNHGVSLPLPPGPRCHDSKWVRYFRYVCGFSHSGKTKQSSFAVFQDHERPFWQKILVKPVTLLLLNIM